jgi:stage II sporulation protein AB (anti-sigma F factor)
MMLNEMDIRFKAKHDNVIFARAVAVSFLMNLNLTLSTVNEIKTVVSEAVTNAIIHGYNSDETKDVEMKLSYDEAEIIIEVIDQGVGISDIEKAKEPLFSTRPEEERAGLGFTIMEVFTDKLEVESVVNEGTKVRMTKRYYEEDKLL